MSEYNWPGWIDRRGRPRGPEEWVILKVSLRKALALFGAVQPRCGVEPKGPTYVQAAMVAAKRAVEAAEEAARLPR